MSKKKIERPSKIVKAKKSFFNSFNFVEIPQKYHIPIIIFIILFLFLFFFKDLYFGNKTFQSGDIFASKAMKSYVEKERDGYTLWNPLIFCGMPAYATATEFKWFNLIYVGITFIRWIFTKWLIPCILIVLGAYVLEKRLTKNKRIILFTVLGLIFIAGFIVFLLNIKSIYDLPYAQWMFYYILLGITTFFLVKHLTKNTLTSLFSAVATIFSTGIIVFLFIGHVTKPVSLWMFPLIFLFLLRMQEKRRLRDYLPDLLFLTVTIQLMIQGFHVQIIFYILFAVLIYYIYFLVRHLIKKEVQLRNNLLISAGIFALSAVIALAIQLDNITQILEYTPYSTRGTESILDKTASGQDEVQTKSNYYAYHTDWSFSPEETATFIIPSFFGFGNSTYKGPLTNNQPVEVNTYFGQMSYVDVAVGYMGIAVIFLALFAIITRWKEPFVQFLTILTGISILISFGKNFPIVFDFLFYNLPYFNKFRVPSMILVLVQLTVPILAGLGLMKIVAAKKEKDMKLTALLKKISIGLTIIFGIVLIFNGAFSGWFTGRVNDYAASISQARPQYAQQFTALADYMSQMFTSDLIFAFAFVSIVFWCGYAYLKSKLSSDIFIAAAIIVTLIDLWRIDARGMHYVDTPQIDNLFKEPAYISEIKRQNDKDPFRILNLKEDGSLGSINQNSNFTAYFLMEDMYGYSGIKPRAYQDYMDVVGPVNPALWRMLNVKYIITDNEVRVPGFEKIGGGNKTFLYKNGNALPRLYFVDSIVVKPASDILNMVKGNSFDPMHVAFLEEGKLKTNPPDSSAYIKIINYKEDNLQAEVSASGNNFLFFGTNYVMPGWKAEIDGNKTKIYKVNHGFMGIMVPKGKHAVKFYYAPESFFISKDIVFVLSYSIVIVLLYLLILKIFRGNKNHPIQNEINS